MTFFANAGIKWPKFEDQSRQAGGAAMDAASMLWKLLSMLEINEDSKSPQRSQLEAQKKQCIAALRFSAKMYADIAQKIDYEWMRPLSSAERDLAAVGSGRRERDLFGDTKSAYYGLADWLTVLADEVEGLVFEAGEPSALLSQVFRLMRRWEMGAQLARVIAVVNRRQY